MFGVLLIVGSLEIGLLFLVGAVDLPVDLFLGILAVVIPFAVVSKWIKENGKGGKDKHESNR